MTWAIVQGLQHVIEVAVVIFLCLNSVGSSAFLQSAVWACIISFAYSAAYLYFMFVYDVDEDRPYPSARPGTKAFETHSYAVLFNTIGSAVQAGAYFLVLLGCLVRDVCFPRAEVPVMSQRGVRTSTALRELHGTPTISALFGGGGSGRGRGKGGRGSGRDDDDDDDGGGSIAGVIPFAHPGRVVLHPTRGLVQPGAGTGTGAAAGAASALSSLFGGTVKKHRSPIMGSTTSASSSSADAARNVTTSPRTHRSAVFASARTTISSPPALPVSNPPLSTPVSTSGLTSPSSSTSSSSSSSSSAFSSAASPTSAAIPITPTRSNSSNNDSSSSSNNSRTSGLAAPSTIDDPIVEGEGEAETRAAAASGMKALTTPSHSLSKEPLLIRVPSSGGTVAVSAASPASSLPPYTGTGAGTGAGHGHPVSAAIVVVSPSASPPASSTSSSPAHSRAGSRTLHVGFSTASSQLTSATDPATASSATSPASSFPRLPAMPGAMVGDQYVPASYVADDYACSTGYAFTVANASEAIVVHDDHYAAAAAAAGAGVGVGVGSGSQGQGIVDVVVDSAVVASPSGQPSALSRAIQEQNAQGHQSSDASTPIGSRSGAATPPAAATSSSYPSSSSASSSSAMLSPVSSSSTRRDAHTVVLRMPQEGEKSARVTTTPTMSSSAAASASTTSNTAAISTSKSGKHNKSHKGQVVADGANHGDDDDGKIEVTTHLSPRAAIYEFCLFIGCVHAMRAIGGYLLYQHIDAGVCVNDASLLLYILLFGWVLFRMVRADSKYWLGLFLAGIFIPGVTDRLKHRSARASTGHVIGSSGSGSGAVVTLSGAQARVVKSGALNASASSSQIGSSSSPHVRPGSGPSSPASTRLGATGAGAGAGVGGDNSRFMSGSTFNGVEIEGETNGDDAGQQSTGANAGDGHDHHDDDDHDASATGNEGDNNNNHNDNNSNEEDDDEGEGDEAGTGDVDGIPRLAGGRFFLQRTDLGVGVECERPPGYPQQLSVLASLEFCRVSGQHIFLKRFTLPRISHEFIRGEFAAFLGTLPISRPHKNVSPILAVLVDPPSLGLVFPRAAQGSLHDVFERVAISMEEQAEYAVRAQAHQALVQENAARRAEAMSIISRQQRMSEVSARYADVERALGADDDGEGEDDGRVANAEVSGILGLIRRTSSDQDMLTPRFGPAAAATATGGNINVGAAGNFLSDGNATGHGSPTDRGRRGSASSSTSAGAVADYQGFMVASLLQLPPTPPLSPPPRPYVPGWTHPLVTAWEIAQGVAHLHNGRGLRITLKSSNIVFDGQWRAQVCDFGEGAWINSCMGYSRYSSNLSVAHLAPEILAGLPSSRAADVYAFGIILWELLTYAPPFVAVPAASNAADPLGQHGAGSVYGGGGGVFGGMYSPMSTLNTPVQGHSHQGGSSLGSGGISLYGSPSSSQHVYVAAAASAGGANGASASNGVFGPHSPTHHAQGPLHGPGSFSFGTHAEAGAVGAGAENKESLTAPLLGSASSTGGAMSEVNAPYITIPTQPQPPPQQQQQQLQQQATVHPLPSVPVTAIELSDFPTAQHLVLNCRLRPPLPVGLPRPLVRLLRMCWAAAPSDRPTMAQVELFFKDSLTDLMRQLPTNVFPLSSGLNIVSTMNSILDQ